MTSDLSNADVPDQTAGHDPLSVGPHDPRADSEEQTNAAGANRVRNRVPDQEEIPAQHNPNALAKALLRKGQAH